MASSKLLHMEAGNVKLQWQVLTRKAGFWNQGTVSLLLSCVTVDISVYFSDPQIKIGPMSFRVD